MSEKKKTSFDPRKKVKNLKGNEIPKSFPSREELEKLTKDKNGNPNIDELPRETVGNVILNCLAGYKPKARTEGFYVSFIADEVVEAIEKKGKVELNDHRTKTLTRILLDMSVRMEERTTKGKDGKEETKEEQVGLYAGWAIARILGELGVTPEDIEEE